MATPIFGVGGDQVLLGGADIGTALQQRGGQPGGHLRGQLLLGEAAAADHAAGILAQQQVDLILGLLDLLLERGNGLRGGVDQLLGLAQIEQRRDAAALRDPGQSQRFLARFAACAARSPARSPVRAA